ncbi:MAG TPA: isoprenylcysteine carboxylmethyltransferase family protein [bacterium]|nr:isoprenylcysteine carboxylmethyltransferase family protein [bacterium]
MSGPPLLVRAGNWLFRWRNLVFPLTFVILLLTGRPRFPAGDPRLDLAMDGLGVAVAMLGQILRAAVIGLVYIRRGGKDGKVHADTLVTEGIFAHSRNPLYVGNFLVVLGLLIVLNSPAGWTIGLPGVLFVYAAITRAEEAFLRGKFGAAYEDYCRRVPRFLPRMAGLGRTLGAHDFDWRKVIRKEYGSTFAWMTFVILLLIRERVANGAGEQVRESWPAWAAAWASLVLLYGIARFLKKKTKVLRLS